MRPLILVGAALLLLGAPARAQNGDGRPDKKPARGENTFTALTTFGKKLAEQKPTPERDQLFGVVVDQLELAQQQPQEKREEFIKSSVDRVNATAVEIEKSPDAKPETVRVIRHGMAEVNFKAGNFEESRGYSTRAIEYDPKDRDAYVQRSNAGWSQRRYDEALRDAGQAVTLNPNSADGWRARAMANYGLGDYLQAAEDARRALALDPQDRTAFAVLKLTEGRTRKTMDMDALNRRVTGEIMGEYHGMLQQLNQADERRRAAEVAGASGQPGTTPRREEMMTSPTAAAEAANKLVRAAAGSLSVKDYASAVEAADRALAQDPNNPAAYYYRAAALNLSGRYDEALLDASKAVALNNSDAAAHDARAFAFNHLGRFRDAVADSHHSLEINPKNPYAYANLGYSHERMGDLNSMLRDLKAAASLNPQFEPVYQDAASRHGLDVEPLSAEGAAARAEEQKARAAAKRKQFVFFLGSSLMGGVFIALGFMHLLSGGKTAKRPEPTITIPAPAQVESAFEIVRTVGMGGMGVVYEAVDRALQRQVALKVVRDELKRDPHAKQRFLEEARTVAALHHPAIVAIHQIVDDHTGLYLVFEFVDGRTLHDLMSERGKLPLEEAKTIIKPVCAALDYAHRHRVVHRDLKPANVMVSNEGAVKVMDFGISRHVREAGPPTTSEGRTGTPEYMAPEQRYGVVRQESDVFSLTACLYEMLTGRRPFAADAGAFAAGDYVKATSLVPELPPAIDALIDAGLHPDPERRVRSARDFWALLERVRDERTVAST